MEEPSNKSSLHNYQKDGKGPTSTYGHNNTGVIFCLRSKTASRVGTCEIDTTVIMHSGSTYLIGKVHQRTQAGDNPDHCGQNNCPEKPSITYPRLFGQFKSLQLMRCDPSPIGFVHLPNANIVKLLAPRRPSTENRDQHHIRMAKGFGCGI